jgi:hypothetical protein
MLRAFAIALGLLASAAHAEPAPTSQFTSLGACHVVAHSTPADLDRGEDWVANRCAGLGSIPVWLVYTETTHLGFGPRRNASGMYAADRNNLRWKLEWRGRTGPRGFEPFAVIVRVKPPAGAGSSDLVVYRLLPNGTSCIIAEVDSNEAARQAADRSQAKYACLMEPQLF